MDADHPVSTHLRLQGSFVPLITPLDENEGLDLAAVGGLVDHHRTAGTDGLFLLGTCGEGPSLTDETKERLLDEVLEKAGDTQVLVGIAEAATKRSSILAQKLFRERVAAYVLMPPIFQYAATAEEHTRHVLAVSDALSAPLILYNLPKKCGGQSLPLKAVRTLVAEGRASGMKDSSGDREYLEGLLQIREEHPSFRIMNGELKTARAALEMGADGLVMSYTNVDPAGCLELIRSVRSGDRRRAEELQKQFLDVWGSYPAEVSFIAKVKSILSAQGLCQNVCCAPNVSAPPMKRHS